MICEAPYLGPIGRCKHHGTMLKNRSAVIATSAPPDFQTAKAQLSLRPDIPGVYYCDHLNVKLNLLDNPIRL
jgi:hypothetical protein